MLAFHWTAPKPPDPVAVPATTPSGVPSAVPSSSASAPSATPPEPKGTVVHFVTEPPGASIKENGKELCAPTPCDVTFKGDDATKAHKLSIEEKGFKAETKSLKPSDATAKPVDVKLTKEKEKAVAPAPKPAPKPETKTEPTPPSGFKDAYDK
jgi:hypothetical protein